MTLKKADYAVLGSLGEVVAIYCKVCGKQIAAMMNGKLKYHADYVEAKIECTDGSFHITNGCGKCLTLKTKKPILDEMIEADAAMQPGGYALARSAIRVSRLGVGIP